MRKSPTTSPRRNRGRTALLTSAATLAVVMATPALAQQTVYLEEGTTVTQNVPLNGADRLVLDISRINADSAELNLGAIGDRVAVLDGDFTSTGGLDTLWLRAKTSQTANVAFTETSNGSAQQYAHTDNFTFTGGTVYEASGNGTVLKLENRSRASQTPPTNPLMELRRGPLRFAGDGVIDLTFSLNADQTGVDRAIVVEAGSTAAGGDGKLDVLIRGGITGVDGALVGGQLDPNIGVIDIRNAGSLTFKGQDFPAGFTSPSSMNIGATTGVLGGEADIFIERNVILSVRSAQAGVLIRSSGDVINRGRLDGTANSELSATAKGIAVFLEGGNFLNTVTVGAPGEGEVWGGMYGVVGASGDNTIVNEGLLRSANGAAIQTRAGSMVTRNRVFDSQGKVNAGRIVGGMLGVQQVAYEDIGETQDLIVNSSTITGDLLMGDGSDTFLYTGATNGVTGQIDGGAGDTDAYGVSVSTSKTVTFDNVLNTGDIKNFEMHGVELNGSNLAVTLEAAAGNSPLTDGIKVLGSGTVTNNAKINDADGYGFYFEHFDQFASTIDFINTADISGRVGILVISDVKTFRNSATISGSESAVELLTLYRSQNETIDFLNTGVLTSTGARALSASLYAAADKPNDFLLGDFRNTGTIRNTYSSADPTSSVTGAAVFLNPEGKGRAVFSNAGTLETTGVGGVAFNGVNGRLDLTNAGLIQSTGSASGGVLLESNMSQAGRTNHFLNTADGSVLANAGGFTGGTYGRAFSFGVAARAVTLDGAIEVENAGRIEATGANSIAVAALGGGPITSANFVLKNTGVIKGGGDTVIAAGEMVGDAHLHIGGYLGDVNTQRTVAGAIQTFATTDLIRNDGTIQGSIDLNTGDDRFEHYGSLDGNLRLGDGKDIFVFGDGLITAGHTVSGGAERDIILADMSGAVDRTIDAAQFKGFESIHRLAGDAGTGKLFVRGTFDVASLGMSDITLHIAAGDTVKTTTGNTFIGGIGSERIVNFGRIEGFADLSSGDDWIDNTGRIAGLSLGDGNDRLINRSGGSVGQTAMSDGNDYVENSGTFSSDLSMGDGDDEVVNSGTITGKLDLGKGNDRYEAVGTGHVGGALDGGDGDDTLVFRLNGENGSIPGGFDNFESFEAYGPGNLQLALNRKIGTLRIRDGANLQLTNAGAYKVDVIEGDDSAQTVTIDAGFTGSVKLFAGDDTLEMELNGLLAGDLDGGLGEDKLVLNLTGSSTINDLFDFEQVLVKGASPLTLEGTLGAGQKITFDTNNNHFILAEGAVFNGKADGGDGTDTLYVVTAAQGGRVLVEGQLNSFEKFQADGDGAIEFRSGTYSFLQANINQDGGLIVGSGAILSGGANGVVFGNGFNRFTMTAGGKLNGRVDGGLGDDVLAFSQARNQSQKLSDVDAIDFQTLAASGEGELHIDKNAAFTGGVLLEGGTVVLDQNFTLTADVTGGDGKDTFDNFGKVVGDINLGLGDDTYVARSGSSVTGEINGGVGGNDTVVFNLNDGIGSLSEDYIDFESVGVYGPGTLKMNLTEDFNSIMLWEGANLDLTSSGGTIGKIIGDRYAQTVTIAGALTGGVELGDGDDTLNLTLGGVLSGQLDGGAGSNDVLNLTLTDASRINGMLNFEVANVTSDGHALTLGGLGQSQHLNFLGTTDDELIIAAGAEFKGTVDGGAGQNLLRILSGASDSRTVVASQILNFQDLVSEGAGTLALTGGAYAFDSVAFIGGNLELGANTTLTSDAGVVFDDGDNRLTLGSGAKIQGGVDAGDGAGVDTLALIQDQGFTRTWNALKDLKGFEALAVSGAGELRFDADAAFAGGVSLNGGTTTVEANMTLTANVQGGDAADTFAILGKVNGDVNLGAGDDRLILTGADGSGLRSGGAGDGDILDFRTNGSYATPTVYDASRYDGFEKLAVSGGVVSMTSNSSWKGLSLTGGRLIGQAGTVLTSETAIDVGVGATFGSAGTVNANINVKGTLSPGASPGTMTVNGDVSFAKGSNLYLEVSPSLSDLLKINGKMSIADGATVDITGLLENTPGAVLDLVVASGGIEGRFTTINKSNSIFGFVAQNGNKLQIRGEFQNDNAYGTNAQRSIAYANAVLGSGQAVQAFTQAVPVLVDANGVSNAAAFEQLTPEAYGSALRIGGETALAIVDSARGLDLAAPETEGFYSFAQGFGLRTELDARTRTGAASAELDMGGVLGGVGYSTGTGATAGGFIGGTTAEQRLEELDATTRSDGVLVGAFAGATYAGVNVNGLVVYDQTEARTLRNMVATPDFARGRYDLTTWTADVSVDYAMSIGGVSVIPTAGVTWVSTERDKVSEAGGGAFALTVDGDRKDGWFADAGVKVTTAMMFEGRAFIPYAEAGVRKVLSDDGQRVTGALTGVEDLQLDVHGVRRDRTVARLAAGFTFEVDPAVTFSAGYAGEYGDNTRHNVSAGVSLKF